MYNALEKNQLEKGFQMVSSTWDNYRCWGTTFLLVIPTLLFRCLGFFSFSVFNLAFHVHVLASWGDSKLLKSFIGPVYFLTLDLMQCFPQFFKHKINTRWMTDVLSPICFKRKFFTKVKRMRETFKTRKQTEGNNKTCENMHIIYQSLQQILAFLNREKVVFS